MVAPLHRNQELRGWKEIADYLRVSVRTAQTLEKEQGLPIHRGSGLRPVVFALSAEVDDWRNSQVPTTKLPTEAIDTSLSSPAEPHRRAWLIRAGVAASVVMVGGAATLLALFGRNRRPAQFTIQGQTLVIRGGDGRTLWRHTFAEPFREDPFYRSLGGGPPCRFADVNGDGRIETLFYLESERPLEQACLYCFTDSGKLLWQFTPGKPVTDNRDSEYRPPFLIAAFEVLQAQGTPVRVVVSSVHNWSFPCQISILDGRNGGVVGEYWHRGHLPHIAVADLDGDGRPEILLGGVNDALEYKQATVVIFDHDRVSGCTRSPAGQPYFRGMDLGSEKAVMLFPKTPLSQKQEFNRVREIHVHSGRVTIGVSEGVSEHFPYIIYEFDMALRPIDATLSGELESLLQQAGITTPTDASLTARALLRAVAVQWRTP